MFEKSVTDLIREIRSKKFVINQTLSEIQSEITKSDLRGNAIQKCCVLHLLGYDMNWIVFHVVESMSSQKPMEKRIGYMSAALLFNQDTPVLMLCTNLIKKDLTSNNVSDCSMALHTLGAIVNRDLARDLLQDVLLVFNHSNHYIRKRAVIALHSIFRMYPEAVSIAISRLKEKLNDEESSVVTAAVSVLCELISVSPKEYLPLAPQLFHLLGTTNNWLQLKVIKTFALLSPHEPRLVRKLIPPLKTILLQSRSISIIYETVHTIIVGGMIKEVEDQTDDLGIMCLEKLLSFLDQSDQNLKYLGLKALSKLLKIRPATGPKHREIILKCLEDGDISIRTRALELVSTLVNPKSLFGVVKRLVTHLTSSTTFSFTRGEIQYRSLVVSTIIKECSKDNYAHMTNFEWYVSVLCDLALFKGLSTTTGKLLSEQLFDICVRVAEIRPFAVNILKNLLIEQKLLETAKLAENTCEFLYAAAWICGEYATEHLKELAEVLVSPKIQCLAPSIQTVYLFGFLKIYSRFQEYLNVDAEDLSCFINSTDLQVQDRACLILAILEENKTHEKLTSNGSPNPWVEKVTWTKTHISKCFDGSLNMVAPLAQANVALTLDLDTWIVPLTAQDTKLIESPTKEEHQSSVESLLTELAIQAEQEDNSQLGSGSKSPAIGSSVLFRPESKKYNLNLAFDGQDLIKDQDMKSNTLLVPDQGQQKKKRSKTKLLPAKLDRQLCSLYKRNEGSDLTLTGSYDHINRDPMALELKFDVEMAIFPSQSFTVELITQNKYSSGLVPLALTRGDSNTFFLTSLQFKLILDNESIDISAYLPFSINFLAPKAHKITKDMFLQSVRNPPHRLDAKLVFYGKYSVEDAAEAIAKTLFCSFQLLDNVASVYAMTVKQTIIVGLIKPQDSGVMVEFKTLKDDPVLSWVSRCMESLGFTS